ncbi:MAG TPA: VCBS domain-containing protein, partial [Gemmataceae bacterium]|nr:VCBS domain-containing protein [Gemmataceae bacterium]
MLDANKGTVVNPGVTQWDYSGYSVDLRAQVSGAGLQTYTWTLDPNHLGDFQNVSSLTNYQLTFNWASFTGGAHTDSITITTSGGITQTLTFSVEGTDSPAYTATPPTSFSLWPTVLAPDAMKSYQQMVGNGPYYDLGLATGEVQTSHMLPSYNPCPPSRNKYHFFPLIR